MSRIKFHLAHFSGFKNPDPSPIATFNSYGTYSYVLKRQIFQDTCWLPILKRGRIWTPTVETWAGCRRSPRITKYSASQTFENGQPPPLVSKSILQNSVFLCSANPYSPFFFVFNHETILYGFHNLKIYVIHSQTPQKSTFTFQHRYYCDLRPLFIWFSVLHFFKQQVKGQESVL